MPTFTLNRFVLTCLGVALRVYISYTAGTRFGPFLETKSCSNLYCSRCQNLHDVEWQKNDVAFKECRKLLRSSIPPNLSKLSAKDSAQDASPSRRFRRTIFGFSALLFLRFADDCPISPQPVARCRRKLVPDFRVSSTAVTGTTPAHICQMSVRRTPLFV